MNAELSKFEQQIRDQNNAYIRKHCKCGYGARYNGATARSEVNLSEIIKNAR